MENLYYHFKVAYITYFLGPAFDCIFNVWKKVFTRTT